MFRNVVTDYGADPTGKTVSLATLKGRYLPELQLPTSSSDYCQDSADIMARTQLLRSRKPSPTASVAEQSATAPRPRPPSYTSHQAHISFPAASQCSLARKSLAMRILGLSSRLPQALLVSVSYPRTSTSGAKGRTATIMSTTSTLRDSTVKFAISASTSQRRTPPHTFVLSTIRSRRQRRFKMSSSLRRRGR